MTYDELNIRSWRVRLKYLGKRLDQAQDEEAIDEIRLKVIELRDEVRRQCVESELWWDEGESIDNLIRKLESLS